MCKLKSAIVLKDRIFMPDYDSHSKMLEELGINDDYLGASKKFVRVEFSPPSGDVFSDIDTWVLRVDQDIRPDWFSEEECKQKMIDAVKGWAKDHIHIGVKGLKISTGENHYINDCQDVEVYGSASISKVYGSASISKVYGSASISYVCDSASISKVYGSASISYVCDSASISYVYGSASISKVYGSASISYVCGSASISKVCGSASISKVCGSASISYVCDSASISEVCDSAMVASSPYSNWKKRDALIISENATFKDNYGKVVYQAGDFKLISVESGKTIGERKEQK